MSHNDTQHSVPAPSVSQKSSIPAVHQHKQVDIRSASLQKNGSEIVNNSTRNPTSTTSQHSTNKEIRKIELMDNYIQSKYLDEPLTSQPRDDMVVDDSLAEIDDEELRYAMQLSLAEAKSMEDSVKAKSSTEFTYAAPGGTVFSHGSTSSTKSTSRDSKTTHSSSKYPPRKTNSNSTSSKSSHVSKSNRKTAEDFTSAGSRTSANRQNDISSASHDNTRRQLSSEPMNQQYLSSSRNASDPFNNMMSDVRSQVVNDPGSAYISHNSASAGIPSRVPTSYDNAGINMDDSFPDEEDEYLQMALRESKQEAEDLERAMKASLDNR
jgi:hypothetical protein